MKLDDYLNQLLGMVVDLNTTPTDYLSHSNLGGQGYLYGQAQAQQAQTLVKVQQMVTQQALYAQQMALVQQYEIERRDRAIKEAMALCGSQELVDAMQKTDDDARKAGFTPTNWYDSFRITATEP